MKRMAFSFVVILVLSWASCAFADCSKRVNDNRIIENTIKACLHTARVSGEPDAVADWCYHENLEQLFLFLMAPCESQARAKKIMEEIGHAILEKSRSNQRLGKKLSAFEETVLKRGFIMQMMQRGDPHGSGLLVIYINPATAP